MPSGTELIAAERKRQVNKEGWSAAHDDGHDFGELARAAVCYCIPAQYRTMDGVMHWPPILPIDCPPPLWPWDCDYWKPTPKDRIRELVKAGALIAAEIDRLIRKDTPNV